MNKKDLKSLEIEKLIRSYISYNDYTAIDIVGVFFHQIMIYASNFYIIKNSEKKYLKKVNFPFLNSEYILKLPKINFKTVTDRKNNFFFKILKFVQFFFIFSNSIDLEDNAFFEKKKFVIKNIFKYKFNKSLNTKIFIENKTQQIQNLRILLEKIAIAIDIKDKDKENFIINFINYVNLYISKTPIVSKSNVLIVGSNANIISRINSAIYLSEGKKVISFSHGEHSPRVFDEPGVGYGELSYCSDYIDFGKKFDYSELEYARPIFKTAKTHYRNSKMIKNFYEKHKSVSDIDFNESSKALYIPTLFASNERYGPFRDIEDDLYQEWQNSIMSTKYNITYKIHPKNQLEIGSKYPNSERKNLKNIIHKYDIYLLDYISTALALCVATNKPIIYFNIGQRNLLKEAKKLLRKRVFWVDINLNKNLSGQVSKAIKDFNQIKKTFINHYTDKFSLSENNESDIHILDRILINKN